MEKVEIKKKHREDWDTVTKKISFDSSYRFRIAWWIMFWIYCGLCAAFLAFGIVVFSGSMSDWDKNTLKGMGLGCGFSIILVFALFWIVNNFINAKMFAKPDYPDEAKKLIKKQAIWSNVFRISAAVLCLVCGLLFVVSGFMWDNVGDNVAKKSPQIINGCTCLVFMGLIAVSVLGYYKMIVLKDTTLNILVPKTTNKKAEI